MGACGSTAAAEVETSNNRNQSNLAHPPTTPVSCVVCYDLVGFVRVVISKSSDIVVTLSTGLLTGTLFSADKDPDRFL